MAEQTIKLVSNDKVEYDVPIKIAQLSQTIKTMLDELGMEDMDVPIPLPNVRSSILEMVLEWGTYHQNDEPGTNEINAQESGSRPYVSEWDKKFFDVDQAIVFDIILAANYLDIKDLLDTGCKVIANMIIGKSVEQIRKTFQIKNDLKDNDEEDEPKSDETKSDETKSDEPKSDNESVKIC